MTITYALSAVILGATVTACAPKGSGTNLFSQPTASASQAPVPTPTLQLSCAVGYSVSNSFISVNDELWWFIDEAPGFNGSFGSPQDVQYTSPFQGTIPQAEAQADAVNNNLTGTGKIMALQGPYETQQQASTVVSQANGMWYGDGNLHIAPAVQVIATNDTSQSIAASSVMVAIYDHLGDELSNDVTAPLNVLTVAPHVSITTYASPDAGTYQSTQSNLWDSNLWQTGTTCQTTGTELDNAHHSRIAVVGTGDWRLGSAASLRPQQPTTDIQGCCVRVDRYRLG